MPLVKVLMLFADTLLAVTLAADLLAEDLLAEEGLADGGLAAANAMKLKADTFCGAAVVVCGKAVVASNKPHKETNFIKLPYCIFIRQFLYTNYLITSAGD
jgi:hypothetical protein